MVYLWRYRKQRKNLSLLDFSLFAVTFSIISLPVNAQIIPDNTLGSESSVVNRINSLMERIDGGAIRGSNLFHSFLEFSIKEGYSAYFANPEGIQTIFSRVTGNNPSLLFGTLGVLGNANLFFINSNGIIFGPNASLDIQDSFIASTANSIIFPDGNKFSATNPQGVPLLTINVPVTVGIQFEEDSSGTIINRGNLGTGNNLSLIGKTIVSTGQLSALNGEINLKTVAGDTQIKVDGTGNILSQSIQPLSQVINSLSLANFVTDVGEVSGLTVNSLGEVTVNGTEIAVNSGDIVIQGVGNKVSLQAQSGNLSAVNNLTLVNSLIGTKDNLTLQANDTVKIRDNVENPFIAVAGGVLKIQGNQQVDIFILSHPNSGLVSGKDMVLRSSNEVIGDAHFWTGGNFQIEKLDGSLGNLSSPNDPIIRSQGDVNFLGYQGASLHIIAGGSVNISTVIITRADSEANTINPTSTPDLANITLSDGTSLVIDGSKRATLDIRAGVDPNFMFDEFIAGEIVLSPDFNFLLFFFNLVIEPFDFSVNPSSADITIGEVLIFPPDGIVLLTNQYQPNRLLSGGDITITGAGVFGFGGIDAIGVGGRGSDVILDARGSITLTGSKIETASDIGNGGNITLLANKNILLESGAFIAADGVLGGNITVKSDADVLVTEGTIRSESATTLPELKGGDINIIARSLFLTDDGLIGTITFGNGKGGNLTVTTSESLEIGGFSLLSAQTMGEGEGGNLTIDTNQLIIREGAEISTITFGNGNGGNLTITASDLVELFGSSAANGFSAKLSTETKGEGGVGNLTLNTERLIVRDGAQISASTFNQGQGGNLSITASESVELVGVSADNRAPSGLFANSGGEGNAGNLFLSTQRLLVRDGAQISAGAFGKGKAGNLTVTASEWVKVVGTDAESDASSLFVKTLGEGDAGNLIIDTKRLLLQDGAQISAGTFGKGKGGILNVTVSESIKLVGIAPDGDPSGLFTATQGGDGDAGNLIIDTKRLLLQDGAQISASTFGKGKAGNLTVTASELVEVVGTDASSNASGLFVSTEGEGDAGNLILNTRQLLARDGAQINASTLGKGKGGSLNVTASESVELFGRSPDGLLRSGLFAVTEGEKDAGNLILNTRQLLVQNGAVISTQTQGGGDAGNLIITSKQFILQDSAIVSAATFGSGKGGTIIVNAPQSVLLGTNSQLTVETTGAGKPGDIMVATDTLTIGEDAQLSATVTATSTNTEGGGGITLNANNLNISGKLGIFAETQSIAPAGNLILKPYNTPNLNIQFTDNGFISATTSADGQGGNINISAPQTLDIRGERKITVETSGRGNAGTIDLTSQNLTLADGLEISASTTAAGKGGSIGITANNFNLNNGSQLRTTTSGNNNAGNITLNIRDNLNLSGTNSGIFADTDLNSLGNGGKIFIDSSTFIIRDGAAVSVNSQGKGTGGDTEIYANFLTLDNGKISAQTLSSNGGNITLEVGQLLWLKNGSQISTTAGTAEAGGDGGNIDIDSIFILSNFYENNDITANAFTGRGGNIRITAQGILGLVIADELTKFSDITASSQFGLDGNIIINTAGIDPTRGLENLPQQTVTSEVLQVCSMGGGKTTAEFYQIGRGGLPDSPDEMLNDDLDLSWTPWVNSFSSQTAANVPNIPISTTTIKLPCQY